MEGQMRELCEGRGFGLDQPCSYCNLFANQLQSQRQHLSEVLKELKLPLCYLRRPGMYPIT